MKLPHREAKHITTTSMAARDACHHGGGHKYHGRFVCFPFTTVQYITMLLSSATTTIAIITVVLDQLKDMRSLLLLCDSKRCRVRSTGSWDEGSRPKSDSQWV